MNSEHQLSIPEQQTPYHRHAFLNLLREAWIEYERDRARYLVQQESIIVTVVSLIGLLLAASVLFRHLRLTFRAIWNYESPLVSGSVRVVVRATLLERVIAFVMVLGGGGLLLAALALIAATQWLDSLPLLGPSTGWLLSAASSLILAALTFAAMFRFFPPVSIRWRDVWLATLLCAVTWVVAAELLALYGVFLGDRRSAYGALGGVLAVMLWMNLVSQTLFFGAELCKVVATRGAAPPGGTGAVVRTRVSPGARSMSSRAPRACPRGARGCTSRVAPASSCTAR